MSELNEYLAYKVLQTEIEKLRRENFGLKQKIKNLEEKLGKRNEYYRGEVFDKDIRKRVK